LSFWRHVTGGVAAFIGAMLWTPVVMFMVWLTVVGIRRPKWGGAMLAVVSISWVGLALLLFLEVLEVA
jgi:hypothetical protein